MNKFEQVSSYDHQMPLTGGMARARAWAGEVSCPGGSHLSYPEGWGQLVEALYTVVQGIIFGQNDRQTRLKTLSFPQLRWRALTSCT